MIACDCANSQGIFLASSIVDSVIWKLDRSDACDSLQRTQSIEINALLNENLQQVKIIQIQKTEISQQAVLILNQQKLAQTERDLNAEQKTKLKQQIRKLKRVAILEGVGAVAVIVVLLL